MKHHERTAAEFMAELMADPEWRAAALARQSEREQHHKALATEEAPLVNDLALAGYPVSSVYDLVNAGTPYPKAIPVLLRHLKEGYSPRIREGIARALTVSEAREELPALTEAFRTDPDSSENGPKWALGNAIEALSDSRHIGAIADLALDHRHGVARSRLVYALARSDSDLAKKTLGALKADAELAIHVEAALGKGKRSRARRRSGA